MTGNAHNTTPAINDVVFGGPDKQKHALRNQLLRHIQAVPAGGSIIWVCYYFNEPVLFDALIHASQRNVSITLILDKQPRTAEVNHACQKLLGQQAGITINSIKSTPLWEYLGIRWHGHLHTKLYYFSHPTPRVLLGSYNPTSDSAALGNAFIDRIGDHSVSHNVLATVNETCSVDYFKRYLENINTRPTYRALQRFSPFNNTSHRCTDWDIDFLPRLTQHPASRLFSRQDQNADIKCAISHLKGPGILRPLIKAAQAGKNITLLLDASQRRVTHKQLAQLQQHHINYQQVNIDPHVLMHNKFILYQSDTDHCVVFGSFNWSRRSWWLNQEVIICCRRADVIAAFEQRWNEMIALS